MTADVLEAFELADKCVELHEQAGPALYPSKEIARQKAVIERARRGVLDDSPITGEVVRHQVEADDAMFDKIREAGGQEILVAIQSSPNHAWRLRRQIQNGRYWARTQRIDGKGFGVYAKTR